MKKVLVTVLGTRPEWTKLAPLLPLLDKKFTHRIVHTGQHFDPALDRLVRADLRLRAPDYRLAMGAKKGFGAQMGLTLRALEKIFARLNPSAVLVQGDTNSSLAGALAAARAGIPVIHLEAGCRSGNLKAPEEQNRLLIDSIASLHLAPDHASLAALKAEGARRAVLAGNTSIDAIRTTARRVRVDFLRRHGLNRGEYALATLHRAENTESPQVLRRRLSVVAEAARYAPVLLSLHPRTKTALRKFGLALPKNVRTTGPLGYLEFVSLLEACRFVLSDSGGIQEEAAALGRPCLVLREETEWTRLIRARKNFLVPALNTTSARLIERLYADEKFYRKTCARRAPGLESGAAVKALKEITGFLRNA